MVCSYRTIGAGKGIYKAWTMMGMGTGTGRASNWPLTCMPGFCLSHFLCTHLHTDLLRVCLHRLQCSQSTTALHNNPAVLWLAQGQDTQGCTALLTYLQDGSQEWLRPGLQTTAITHFPDECPKTHYQSRCVPDQQ